MTNVSCDLRSCKYNLAGACQSDIIHIAEDCVCYEFTSYDEDNPAYKHQYWKACFWKPREKNRKNQEVTKYRMPAYGLRYEFGGLVFYTGDDIRQGIEFADFTEERSGMRLKGHDLLDEESFILIKKASQEAKPVIELPWMHEDPVSGVLVEHKTFFPGPYPG